MMMMMVRMVTMVMMMMMMERMKRHGLSTRCPGAVFPCIAVFSSSFEVLLSFEAR